MIDLQTKISVAKIAPERSEVLKRQGVESSAVLSERILNLADEALAAYSELAKPIAIIREISHQDYEPILAGNGQNEPTIPLSTIWSRAEGLALYALTIGAGISKKIEDLFSVRDFALAAMLDTTASAAAEHAVEYLEGLLTDKLGEDNKSGQAVLAYAPGYCGWHISAQKKLFAYLDPGRIGIQLNDSCLMTPLKSTSGVLLTGAPEIHVFPNNFPFCDKCDTLSCRTRIARIMSSVVPGNPGEECP